jgi:hypothetical protein
MVEDIEVADWMVLLYTLLSCIHTHKEEDVEPVEDNDLGDNGLDSHCLFELYSVSN